MGVEPGNRVQRVWYGNLSKGQFWSSLLVKMRQVFAFDQFRKTATTLRVDGKSVAKVIMPAAVFVQMKEHFDKVFNALAQEGIVPKLPEDKGKDERHSTSNVG